MNHDEETIKTAREYINRHHQPLFRIVAKNAFLAGAEYKQKEVEELVKALRIAVDNTNYLKTLVPLHLQPCIFTKEGRSEIHNFNQSNEIIINILKKYQK